MKTVFAESQQTLFDISLQELGSIEGAFDILDLNPGLELDMDIGSGTKVFLPEKVINKPVHDYYSINKIKPVSGLGEDIVITIDDMNNIKQTFNYDLSGGSHEFAGLRAWFLHDKLTCQITYDGITSDLVTVYIDQSLDGINWSHLPDSGFVLDITKTSHTYNVLGLLTNYVRITVELGEASEGIIKDVTWRT